MIRKIVRNFLNSFGYEIAKLDSLSIDISLGAWIHKLNIETIIDVGSNEGQFINSINGILPNRKIFAFEPIKSVFEKMVANTKGLNVKAFNMALSDQNGTAEINVSKNFESSSLLKMQAIHKKVYPESEYVRKETIQTGRLDDVININDLTGNTLLKIDVQGYENKVIAGGKKVIDDVAAVIIEFSYEPIYEGQWLFDETHKYFTTNGFRFIGMASQVSNKVIGIPLYGDAIFVREDLAKLIYA
jgi:FkbM family methyltransferase